MVKELTGVGGSALPLSGATGAKTPGTEKSFGDFLSESLKKVDDLQKGSDAAVEQMAKGEGPGIQEAMVAIEKADVAFKLMMEVRQRILDAYQEVIRMQV
ncbi:MAG: flagellar hook-basal body complex protein FliE [Deltaproteobacteria bacterium]|nr:flagellar hook-basal body complex protein FliE [Deltaproteobacteria bacterium]